MSAPEVRCAHVATAVMQVASFRGKAAELAAAVRADGWSLPAFGTAHRAPDRLALCVRPERWLLLAAPAARPADPWEQRCAGLAGLVDLSAGFTVLLASGGALRETLSRGCRLDLEPAQFAPGQAAATLIAQVSVILVALSSGMLLLTPRTTAGHFLEWLAHSAAPFGFAAEPDRALAHITGELAT